MLRAAQEIDMFTAYEFVLLAQKGTPIKGYCARAKVSGALREDYG